MFTLHIYYSSKLETRNRRGSYKTVLNSFHFDNKKSLEQKLVNMRILIEGKTEKRMFRRLHDEGFQIERERRKSFSVFISFYVMRNG